LKAQEYVSVFSKLETVKESDKTSITDPQNPVLHSLITSKTTLIT
jgi:hypothetical protein